jgi:hypothetical protein
MDMKRETSISNQINGIQLSGFNCCTICSGVTDILTLDVEIYDPHGLEMKVGYRSL